MAVEIVMPRMGLTMEEGTVVAWLKRENQTVAKGEPLLEIETDKSTVEIESPGEGVLSQILVKPGETVPVGAVIGYLTAPGERLQSAPSAPAVGSSSASVQSAARVAAPTALEVGLPGASSKVKASPAARRLARQYQVDLAEIIGTGPGGRVVAWNVREFAGQVIDAKQAQLVRASPVAQKAAADLSVDLRQVKGTGPGGWITRADVERSARQATVGVPAVQPPVIGEKIDLTRQQRIMAERMASSFRETPHFYLHVDVDARRLAALRENLLKRAKERFGVHLTYTDFLVKYCALVLRQHPKVLQQWAGDGLFQMRNINIGLAMDTPNGLVVPVIHDADQLSLAEISRRRTELSERAQVGKLLPQDLELGVFTITNLGMFGIDYFDAILNPPQAAILAVGRIKERALVEAGQVIAAPMMTLSLSVDHRVLDGATAAKFLGDLVEYLENPDFAQV
jgi:pyruvate dehydrogenase E2 component (dihydrolipoamide acetyltransferase)